MDTRSGTKPKLSSKSIEKRVDAKRNRDRILFSARSALAGGSGEVSMAEISRRAGVGMATLYRNFPSRRHLLEALYTDEVDAICAAAQSTDGATAAVAFVTWLNDFFAFAMKKRHVAVELLERSERTDPVFTESRGRVLAAGRPLLTSAQRARELRKDITLEQILDLVVAIASIQGEPRYLKPIFNTALDGLRI